MRFGKLGKYLLILLSVIPLGVRGQNNDCPEAVIICDDGSITFEPQGAGDDDFASINNGEGCLLEREVQSAWYWFEFKEWILDADSNRIYMDTSGMEIWLSVAPTAGGKNDYDFAIYGPNLSCDSLGEPLRCSFADPNFNLNPFLTAATGLWPYVVSKSPNPQGDFDTIPVADNSEGRLRDELGGTADGFVRPMVVYPRQGFFLLLDYFQEDLDEGVDRAEFNLKWGGPAAPFLNCVGNPNCQNAFVVATPDTVVCSAPDLAIQLRGEAFNTNGNATLFWTADPSIISYLDDTTSTQPVLRIPDGFTGSLTYTFVAEEGLCVKEASVTVEVLPAPQASISGELSICPGDPTTLSVPPGLGTYDWSTGDTGPAITVSDIGRYAVTVTGNNGCATVDEVEVLASGFPEPLIDGERSFCEGGFTVLRAGPGLASYRWSTGDTVPEVTITRGGDYGVTLTNVDGCEVIQSIPIAVNPLPVAAIDGQDYFCEGTSTALTASGGTLYEWSDGRTGATIDASVAGAYSVTVTDDNQCINTAAVTVDSRPNPVPFINGDTSFCSGANTILAGPQGFPSYAWSSGQTSRTILVDSPGDFGLTVTDSLGCQGTARVSVDTISRPDIRIAGPQDLCTGDTIELSVAAGFASYRWSSPSQTNRLDVTSGGTYRVTVTNADRCTTIDSLAVTERALPTPLITGQDYFCEGSSTLLEATPGFVEYQWSDGRSGPQVEASVAGSYTVTVRDDFGCLGTADFDLREEAAPNAGLAGETEFCSGTNTVLVADFGFTAYRWSTGQTTRLIDVTDPGTYSVTVTDTLGCEGSMAVPVDTLPRPDLQVAGIQNFCEGDSITLDAGTGFTTYRWSTGAQTPSITIRRGGGFAVTVTNDFGCASDQDLSITRYPIRLPETEDYYPLCEGETRTLDAGAGFNDYRWSTGESTQSIVVDAGGTYSVMVVDSNGCETQRETTVEAFEVLPVQIRGPAEFCSSNTVMLLVDGPYVQFQWSTGATTRNIDITNGGTYAVTATDGNGCVSDDSWDILEKPSPDIVLEGPRSFCEGDSIVLSVDSRYSGYIWSNGALGPSIVVREPGFYGVQVSALNGCITNEEVEVLEIQAPTPAIDGKLFLCPEETTSLKAEDGFVSYRWSTNESGPSILVDAPGFYSVTVTDTTGCVGASRTLVQRLPGPEVEIRGDEFLCLGSSTALSVDSIYRQYQWSTGDTSPVVTIDREGIYQVVVTDQDGCTATDQLLVQSLPLPEFSVSGDPFFCEGSTTTLSVSSLFPRYRWSNGGEGRSIIVDSAGTYNVSVTSTLGCVNERQIEVRTVPLPVADAGPAQIIDCRRPLVLIGGPGSSRGTIYRYDWQGPGINEENQGRYNPAVGIGGNYTLVVVDTLHSCPSLPALVEVDDYRYEPRAVARLSDTLDCNISEVTIDASESLNGSTIVYQWLDAVGQPLPGADSTFLTTGDPGLYTFTVTDTLNGCQTALEIMVPANRQIPLASTGGARQLDCINSEVVINASASAAGSSISYTWDTPDGNILSAADPLAPVVDAPGLYILTVLDQDNGCSDVDSMRVTRNVEAPVADAGSGQELNCDLPAVILDGTASRGGGPISFQWTLPADPAFSSTEPQTEVGRPGRYYLLVTDQDNGCTAFDSVLITLNEDVPTAIGLRPQATTCFGDQDGRILIDSVSGGAGPYLFRLNGSPFVSTAAFNGLASGSYELTVQDVNGCELETTVEVAEGNDLRLYVGEDRVILLGDSVTLQAQANVPGDQISEFRWTRPETILRPDSMVIRVGPVEMTTYAAYVTDVNGCVARDNVTIIVREDARVYIPNAFSPNNDGANDQFMIFAGNDVVRINYLRIFDRWGTMVFQQNDPFAPNDPAFGWDGRHKGRYLDPNVFVYVTEIELINGEVKVYKGDVNLIR